MKKRILTLSAMFTVASHLFAATLFSGEAGLSANFTNKGVSSFDPSLTFDSFFSGQFTISKSLSIRGELSVQTEDAYDNGPFTETTSQFRIDELSASYAAAFGGYTHTFSLFLGFFETIGTQQYYVQQLGAQKFSSLATDNYLNLNGPSPYPLYGFGGAYSIKFNELPMSTGIVISRNTENEEDVAQLNIDWRLAASFRYFSLDLLAGLGAPLYTKDENNDEVVLLIDTIYLHTGFDMLIGNRYTTSLFIQCGLDYLPVKSSSKSQEIEARDMYLLFEPRFSISDLKLHLTLFSIPESKAAKMLLIDDTLGVNFCMFTDGLYTKNRDYTAGINWMVSFEDKNFMSIADEDLVDTMNIKVAPFIDLHAMGGNVKIMLQANVMKFTEADAEAIKLNIGYKKEL